MNLPSHNINNFNLGNGVNLFKLSAKTDCKYHKRVWDMSAFYLLARFLEKQKEREQMVNDVKKLLGKKGEKLSPDFLMNLNINVPTIQRTLVRDCE